MVIFSKYHQRILSRLVNILSDLPVDIFLNNQYGLKVIILIKQDCSTFWLMMYPAVIQSQIYFMFNFNIFGYFMLRFLPLYKLAVIRTSIFYNISCFYTKLGIAHVYFQIFLLFYVKNFAMNMICPFLKTFLNLMLFCWLRAKYSSNSKKVLNFPENS